MKRLAAFLIATLAYSPANSAILPTPQSFDYRMTVVKYNMFDVVNVRSAIGQNTIIQLEQGEKILREKEGLMLGDPKAWGFEIIENSIFLKPKAYNPDTNLIITTDKGRTYTFYLMLSEYPHYLVKMSYDKPKEKPEDKKVDVPCFNGEVNYEYVKWGDDELAPDFMWDDGRFTCLKFVYAKELPVIYQVVGDGSESMVNYHMNSNTMVVHSVSDEWRLRLGEQVLGLKTPRVKQAQENQNKTTIDAKRVVKHE